MPANQRPAMRTYTIRHLRAEQGEVDIDFVLHGETGPASRWAIRSGVGEPIQIVAPDRQFSAQDAGGFEWKPPHTLKHLLLVADATALPAALGIARRSRHSGRDGCLGRAADDSGIFRGGQRRRRIAGS